MTALGFVLGNTFPIKKKFISENRIRSYIDHSIQGHFLSISVSKKIVSISRRICFVDKKQLLLDKKAADNVSYSQNIVDFDSLTLQLRFYFLLCQSNFLQTSRPRLGSIQLNFNIFYHIYRYQLSLTLLLRLPEMRYMRDYDDIPMWPVHKSYDPCVIFLKLGRTLQYVLCSII